VFGQPSRKVRKKLAESGRSSPAVVLKTGHGMTSSSGSEVAWTTWTTMKVSLRVEPIADAAFEWEGRLRFLGSHTPERGGQIWVRYDAENHEHLILDTAERTGAFGGVTSKAFVDAGTPAQSDPSDVLSAVERAREAAGDDRQALVQSLREQLGADATIIDASGAPAQSSSGSDHVVDQLAKLADLRDRGALTAEEFEAQKRRLLDGQG
jgi:hypothetical protein